MGRLCRRQGDTEEQTTITAHDYGVLLEKPCYSLGRLSTCISFAKTPTQVTNKYSSRLFLQVCHLQGRRAHLHQHPHTAVFQVQEALLGAVKERWSSSTSMTTSGCSSPSSNSTPSLAVPFVKVETDLLCTWVKNPVQDLVPPRCVSFRYDLSLESLSAWS